MNEMRKNQKIGKEAVVIGASMAGILAARAVSDYYDQVTLIERDVFPTPGEQRKGVPQGRHAHGLLASGFRIMEGFFPDLKDELVEQGAIEGSPSKNVRWNMGPGFYTRFDSELIGLLVSRPLLEANLRARLLALPNVRAIASCDVLGLETTPDHSRVTGVRILRRQDGSAEEVLHADLVVDASGRGSRSPAWLEALGYERPTEDQVRINITYTTRVYRRDPRAQDDTYGFILGSTDENRRAAAMLAVEGDRWVVSLGGYFGDAAPSDEAGFLTYARSLNVPDVYEALKNAEPIGEAAQFKYPASLRRRYEHLQRFPTGYLVIGDAICSFNPIYGQGMSVAAQEAVLLGECLREGPERLAQRFFARASKVIDIPWSIAVGADLRYPEVEGPRSRQTKFINWYLGKVHAAACHDPVVALAFLRVSNLLAPPTSLMHPRIALRVFMGRLFHRKAAQPSVQERVQPA